MSTDVDLRPSPIAGLWYSRNPGILGSEIDQFIQQAIIPELAGEVIGLVAPHAGYRYSGYTAGHAYRTVLGKEFDVVAVLSPLHSYHPASVLTSSHDAYVTPLGSVLVDREGLKELESLMISDGGGGITAIGNDDEHSLEIQLPFLQRALQGEFKLLPLMIRNQSMQAAEKLGKALGGLLKNRSVLLVASTDLSHFYPSKQAEQYDDVMLQRIASFSPGEVLQAEINGEGFACGGAAVATALWAGHEMGANRIEILHRSNSGAETGDFSRVVGYGAAVILRTT